MLKFTRISILLSILLTPLLTKAQNPSLYALTCNYAQNPLGLDNSEPLLSWKIASIQRNVTQSHYEIEAANNKEDLLKRKKLIWNTGKTASDQSQYINYQGKKLSSNETVYWRARVWDNHGKVSEWSEVNSWKMGLLTADDWKAKWIHADFGKDPRVSPLLRKEMDVSKKIKSATAYITALGLYEAYINGEKIGDAFFTPGWTTYEKRLQYQAYDVTALLKPGKNTIGATLGDGWYNGTLSGKKDAYKHKTALLLQIEIAYTDGTSDKIITDESWDCTLGPIRYSSIYHGEHYDSQAELTGWNTNKYNTTADWKKVSILEGEKRNLIATVSPPVRKKESLKARELIITPKGDTIIDFGQNLTGWVKVKASGKNGHTIQITHAEVLDKKGEFYTTNLRKAKQELLITLNGSNEQTYEPKFSFQGFRYIKIENYPGKLLLENLEAIALYSDMPETGTFQTSNAKINQLQSNILWGQKGNFLDVPTDCPQRDERLGWTGDAQAFFYTSAYNMDIRGFFEKWLGDLKADQFANGNVPVIIPNFRKPGKAGSAGWSDAATMIPWQFYVAYGDASILEKQYQSMKSWVHFIETESTGYLWNKGTQHYGDWLFYAPEDDLFGKAAVTSKHLIAQTFYAHSVQNLIHAATVLGKNDDVVKYSELLKKIKEAFINEYATNNGQLISDTQTAYILALNFDLFPEHMRKQAAERLVKNIREYGHITTGFLGTPYICEVLSRFGYTEVAYELLMREKYPSWLYPVTKGATTIWERWDGIKPNGDFQNASMNSFNHYAYGAVGDWMYKRITGIRPDESTPGYKHTIIAPEPGGGLTTASATLETVYGTVKSAWQISGDQMRFEVVIPANTTASVKLPLAPDNGIKESGQDIQGNKNFTSLTQQDIELGSGSYVFTYTLKH